jgi:hypothetical protein
VVFALDGFGLLFVLNLGCSIAAWALGSRGMARVDRGETSEMRGIARAGRILGIAGTVVGVGAIAVWIVVIAS